MISGNKGEWSEIYALFKLLGDKKLFAGDADLKKVESLFYPIIKIIRSESGGNYEYEIAGDLVVISGGIEELRIPVKTFFDQAFKLLSEIKGATGAFELPETEKFMKSINCGSLKAKSTLKSDIRIVIYDQRINQSADLGFSIKSQLGGDSTLLNAGKTTNFIYKIVNCTLTNEEIGDVNCLFIKRGSKTHKDIKGRISKIKDYSGKFNFEKAENVVFGNNLTLIDSSLPRIIAEIIFLYFTSGYSKIADLVQEITKLNPLNYDLNAGHPFYSYKIKRFLTDTALGMMPSKVWSGKVDATGGYLIVKEDGEILCYHIYNRNQFEDYLFYNTRLETASSSRHDFADIFYEDDVLYFKLNLQIRFI